MNAYDSEEVEPVTDDVGHEGPSVDPLEPHQVDSYEPAAELLRALSAPIRLALVDLLIDGPRCVHELVDALSVSQPLVSQHLKTLRQAGLLTTQRRGREVVYQLVDHHICHVARDILAHSRELHSHTPTPTRRSTAPRGATRSDS